MIIISSRSICNVTHTHTPDYHYLDDSVATVVTRICMLSKGVLNTTFRTCCVAYIINARR
jgi:hypothetical protein